MMVYAGIILAAALIGIGLRCTVFSPMPRTIASLADAERLVEYHIQAANRRLRRDAWLLTFVVPQLDLEKRVVTVRIGINYRRRGYPNYIGGFQQAWANAQLMLRAKERIAAAFARHDLQANIDTFT
ncbi:MAG: hypothetical protein HYZ81_09875 [Nitrospinae bacterium]|nr:hypothetical protein [Nitrospinota bacterium]